MATASKIARPLAAVPPENVPRMSRTRPLTRAVGAPNTRFASSCTKKAPSSNGTESKPQENTMRARSPSPGLVLVDHPPHPDRLAAEIEIIGARRSAGRHQFVTVKLIGPDRRQHRPGLVDHRLQRRRIAGIGDDQRRVRRRADRVANRFELVEAAAGHRPFQLLVVPVMRGEIFGDELAGEPGRAIDNDVKLFRRLHFDSFLLRHYERSVRRVGKAQACPPFRNHAVDGWWARRKCAFAHPTRIAPRNDDRDAAAPAPISSRNSRPCRRAHRLDAIGRDRIAQAVLGELLHAGDGLCEVLRA